MAPKVVADDGERLARPIAPLALVMSGTYTSLKVCSGTADCDSEGWYLLTLCAYPLCSSVQPYAWIAPLTEGWPSEHPSRACVSTSIIHAEGEGTFPFSHTLILRTILELYQTYPVFISVPRHRPRPTPARDPPGVDISIDCSQAYE